MLAQDILNSLVKSKTNVSADEYDLMYNIIDYTIKYMIDKYKLSI